jgi:hypothetical protein
MLPKNRFWVLNGATIRSVRGLVKQKEFLNAPTFVSLSFLADDSKWNGWKMKYYPFAFKPLRSVPGFRRCL